MTPHAGGGISVRGKDRHSRNETNIPSPTPSSPKIDRPTPAPIPASTIVVPSPAART